MKHGKVLHTVDIKDLNFKLTIYGIFDTVKVMWDYYVISNHISSKSLTRDVCTRMSYNMEASIDNISTYGKKISTVEEGQIFCDEFKIKWESGSNNTTQEIRDKKINDVLS